MLFRSDYCVSRCVSPWVYRAWDSLHFLDLGAYFLSHVREVFDYNLFKYFLVSFLSLFFFWDPYNANVALTVLMLSQRSPRLSSFLFIPFSLFCSATVNSTILSSVSLIYSSASGILLLIPSSIFFMSIIVLFISVFLFFNSSRSLLNISCIFLIFASILFLRSWILFTIIILNSFLEGYLSPLHLVVFWGFILFLHLGHSSLPFHFVYLSLNVVFVPQTAGL